MIKFALLYYNKLNLTRRAIDSILTAGYLSEEILCYNNGSNLETGTAVQKLYPDIIHLGQQKNTGYSGGCNRAIESAFEIGADNVLFLTNDVVLQPLAQEEIINCARKSGAGIVAPCISYLRQPDKIDSIGGYFDPESVCLQHYHSDDLPLKLGPADYVPGTAFWINQLSYQQLDGMDESFHTYWEDVDFSFRAHSHNIDMVRAYKARIRHGVGQTCHKKPEYTTFYFQRNRIRFCRKWLSGKTAIKAAGKINDQLNKLEQQWIEKEDSRRLKYLSAIREEFTLWEGELNQHEIE